jgi:hypothetical protein
MERNEKPQTAAFPIEAGNSTAFDQRGLTKRELFAAMAMQSMLANGEPMQPDRRSLIAVKHADALLAALATSANLKEPQQ